MQMQRSSFAHTSAIRAYCQLYYCVLNCKFDFTLKSLSYPTSPVFKRIGLGAWQAFCSGEGFFNKPETKSQRGLDVFEPCLKSKHPGPSVVPAAKLKGRDYDI